jgi:hypothetical protein
MHEWAEFSEKASDVIDLKIKYGGGGGWWGGFLTRTFKAIATYEIAEASFAKAAALCERFEKSIAQLRQYNVSEQEMEALQKKALSLTQANAKTKKLNAKTRKTIADLLTGAISRLDNAKEQKP